MLGFSDMQRRALQAKLNPRNVHVRTEGERELSYIEGWHAVAEANRVFGFEGWDRETVSATMVSQSIKGGLASCSYVARVRIRVCAMSPRSPVWSAADSPRRRIICGSCSRGRWDGR